MIYELFHKDVNVLTAEYEPETNKFGKILSVENEAHLPVGTRGIPGHTLSQGIQFWWRSRLIPRNRSNLKINNLDIDALLTDSNGFNLSDQYWIRPRGSDMTWKKGNFHLNPFDEDFGAFITGQKYSSFHGMSSQSPDLFSNGQQDKRWVIRHGERVLVKYGRPPYYEQPFNEMLASEICRRLGFPHVRYTLLATGKSEPLIYSMCPCFISQDTEFVPAGFVQYALPKKRHSSSYGHLLECCEAVGMPDMDGLEKSLARMNILDYIMANTDRHYGNFGFMRNAGTLEWLGAAPNFDTGNSMFYEYPTSDLRKSLSIMENVRSMSFATSQKKQAERFADRIAALNVDFKRLEGIGDFYRDLLSRNPKEDTERIDLLSGLLMQRIKNLQSITLSKSAVVRAFLAAVRADSSDRPLMEKVKSARRRAYDGDYGDVRLVDEYLAGVKAKNLEDFERKLAERINKSRTKQCRDVDSSISD